jgi:hypothetical protein
MSPRLIVRAALAVFLFGGAAIAGPQLVSVKVGQSAAGYEADLVACVDLARTWPADVMTGLPPPIGGAEPIDPRYRRPKSAALGLTGAAIVAGLSSDLEELAQARLQRDCLSDRGYTAIALDEEETRAYAVTGSLPQQAVWLARLSTGGIGERIRSATVRTPAPLPAAQDEPFAIGAIRLDPGSLSLAPDPVAAGMAVVTGSASHRRTAKLERGFSFLGVQVPTGSEFMQFDSPMRWNHMTAWCQRVRGPVHYAASVVVPDAVWCFRAADVDYEVLGSFDWFPTSVADATADKGVRGPIELKVDSQDALGPLNFALVVEKVRPTKVTLSAQVTQSGQSAVVWRGSETFDADGRAELPFWTKRLVLMRDSAGVKGMWENGDGRGWADQPGRGKPSITRMPTSLEIAYVYPRTAFQNHIGGSATIECGIGADAANQACRVVAETPVDQGFGTAALLLVPYMEFDRSAQARGGQTSVRFTIAFTIPAFDSWPNFKRRPIIEWGNGDRHGHLAIGCTVDAEGVPQDCEVLNPEQLDSDLEGKALAAMRRATFTPAMKDGKTVEADVIVPVTY